MLASGLLPSRARADIEPAEPQVRPTLPWLVTQALPSPEIVVGSEGALYGMQWQVTPLLYSFGMHRRLSPWRVLVVEPIARQSGSIELHVSPEYVASDRDNWLVRAGVRTYLPVLHRGEYLSVSFGTSFFRFDDKDGMAYDLGAYVLFGILGVQVTLSPSHAPLAWITTLRVRYF